MDPIIELDNVTKLYGNVIGANDISLSLAPGAYGLLGPNGSGKSTLLNLIMGQLRPTIGTVRVMGQSPLNNQRLYQRLGYCPSHEGMYAHISGLEWVCYLQELHGMTKSDAAQAAKQAMELVGMTYAMHRQLSDYSRGMRQRTKLAQAIAHDPVLLILDEPFNGLDPIGRHELASALRQWIQRGKSLLLASHILHEVESVTHSFLLICGGRLLASGTAAEVQEMLIDLPNEITVGTSTPQELARLMLQTEVCDSIRVDGQQVVASTRSPSQLMTEMPAWVIREGIEIYEVKSGDESLQALFSTLLQIHRGEV